METLNKVIEERDRIRVEQIMNDGKSPKKHQGFVKDRNRKVNMSGADLKQIKKTLEKNEKFR